jgi:hypothetical protein
MVRVTISDDWQHAIPEPTESEPSPIERALIRRRYLIERLRKERNRVLKSNSHHRPRDSREARAYSYLGPMIVELLEDT